MHGSSTALDDLKAGKHAAEVKAQHLIEMEGMLISQKKEIQDKLVQAKFENSELEKKFQGFKELEMANRILKDQVSKLKAQEDSFRLSVTEVTRRNMELEDDNAGKEREVENLRINLGAEESFSKDLQARLEGLEEQNKILNDQVGQGMEWGTQIDSWKESKQKEIRRLEQLVSQQKVENEELVDENTRLLHEAGEQMHKLHQEMEDKENLSKTVKSLQDQVKSGETAQEGLRMSNVDLQSRLRNINNRTARTLQQTREATPQDDGVPGVLRPEGNAEGTSLM